MENSILSLAEKCEINVGENKNYSNFLNDIALKLEGEIKKQPIIVEKYIEVAKPIEIQKIVEVEIVTEKPIYVEKLV